MRIKTIYVILVVFIFQLFLITKTNSQEVGGKELFLLNRCANCHTIGRGKFVGPDLSKVAEVKHMDNISAR